MVQSWVSRARQLKAYAPAVGERSRNMQGGSLQHFTGRCPFPLPAVFWFTILQLVVAPFKFDIGMPAPMRVALDSLASVLYVEVCGEVQQCLAHQLTALCRLRRFNSPGPQMWRPFSSSLPSSWLI